MNDLITTEHDSPERRLTAAQFQGLAEVPAAAEWFANLDNPRTRRAYQGDIEDFCSFLGIQSPDQFRVVTRAHVLAWRGQLEQRDLSGATIRRKLAALASSQLGPGVPGACGLSQPRPRRLSFFGWPVQ